MERLCNALRGGLILAAFTFVPIFMFVTWFKYGFRSAWLYLHCFTDHWKKWLIFLGILFIIWFIVSLIVK